MPGQKTENGTACRESEKPSRFIHMRHYNDSLWVLGKSCHAEKNETIIRAGEIPSACYLVKSGQVAAVAETGNGNELIFCLMEANSTFAEANVLFRRRLPVTFRAMVPTELLRIRREELEEAVHRDNELALALLEEMSDKFFAVVDENQKMKSHSAVWMLCDLLQVLIRQYGVAYDDKILIQKRLSIDRITSMLGVNRATTVRALRSLKDLNLLENINGYYCVRSEELLRRHQETLSFF